MDWVGALIETARGNKYLLTAIDLATSKAYAVAHPERSGAAAVELMRRIIYECGKPSEVLTDNGEEFCGSEFEAKYKIKHKYTSPGHPQTNGKVERLNHESSNGFNVSQPKKITSAMSARVRKTPVRFEGTLV